jgi:hypothetical protein
MITLVMLVETQLIAIVMLVETADYYCYAGGDIAICEHSISISTPNTL